MVLDLVLIAHRPGDHLGGLILGFWLIGNSIYLIVT
jgi:hypothetical protein